MPKFKNNVSMDKINKDGTVGTMPFTMYSAFKDHENNNDIIENRLKENDKREDDFIEDFIKLRTKSEKDSKKFTLSESLFD